MYAKLVTTITVIDPDTNLPVDVQIFKEEAGGMVGVDVSFLENTSEPVLSPYGNGELEGPDFED